VKDKVVVITGASKGIGAELARQLSREGCKLVLAARNMKELEAVAEECKKLGAPVITVKADVGLERECAAIMSGAALAFGRIDVLVNNAGVFEPIAVDAPDAEWQAAWSRTMTINLQGSADLCRRAILHWRDRGVGGRIVNVASRAAYRGDSPAHWHYAASKAAMVAMTKSIARGYAGQEILAFAVCPGFTMTGMAEDYLASRGGDKLLADIPLGRVASPQEVAGAVAYLALDAPPSMTGAVLDINGASYVR